MHQASSKLFNNAVEQLSSLPGIGNKTAVRLVLQLLTREAEEIEKFGKAFSKLANEINYCKNCYNLSDDETCTICANPSRSDAIICVVENILDVIAIENTNQFKGKYHDHSFKYYGR